MDKQIRTGKPTKMFVYLPVYLKEKKEITDVTPEMDAKKKAVRSVYVRTVIKVLPFSRIEIGDPFIVIKRDSMAEILDSKGEFKVEQVKRSMIDGSCIVVLERITFTNKEKLSEFMKNKRSCI